MRFDRKSADYQANMEAFEDMDLYVPMTRVERNALRSWARRGYDVETNPWGYTDCDGWPLNYLQAYRLKNGYSSGPWTTGRALPNSLSGMTLANVLSRERTTAK